MPVLHFICNGVFTTTIAGGDIHFLKIAEGAAAKGWQLNFFGGHALQEVLAQHKTPGEITLTDAAKMGKVNTGELKGQFAMFSDFAKRYLRTRRLMREKIQPGDYVYAVSDYWFDVLPAVQCAAQQKLMVLHMEAPRFGQIVRRSRPDVDPARLASMHYWGSQECSLRRFCRLGRKQMIYLHPLMEPRLQALGCREGERTLVSYGLDVGLADSVPAQEKEYDVVWIGRVHRQKGVEDLAATLKHLSKRFQKFRAIMIGNVREALTPYLQAAGVDGAVEFSGFVSEAEKIRLFKASRLFLMPSRHEGSPRVIGESVVCGVPTVAYDIPNYRPLFGDYARYVPPFDREAFQAAAERELNRIRGGNNYLDKMDLAAFKRENSWDTVQGRFVAALERFAVASKAEPAGEAQATDEGKE